MGETVRGTDDEGVEEVLRVQSRGRLAGTRRGRGLRGERSGGTTGDATTAASALLPGTAAHGTVVEITALVLAVPPLTVGHLLLVRRPLGLLLVSGAFDLLVVTVAVRLLVVSRPVRLLVVGRPLLLLIRRAFLLLVVGGALVLLFVRRAFLLPVVVLRLLGRVRVRVALGEAEPRLLPAVLVLRPRPGARFRTLVVRVRGAGGRELVGAGALGLITAGALRMVVRAAAVRVVRLMGLVLALALGRGRLGLFVAVLLYGGADGAGCSPTESSTVIAIRIGRPHSRLSVSATTGASRPSSTPFANSFGTASSAVSATSARGWQRRIQCSSFVSTPCPRPSPRSCSRTRGHTAARSAGTSATGHALSQVPRRCGSGTGRKKIGVGR